jgi:hypothetical protein
MKISSVVKRTGVPKETIHFYIREGLLRKPRKAGINIADYTENHVKQILFIKELRDNFYFPIPLNIFVRQTGCLMKQSSEGKNFTKPPVWGANGSKRPKNGDSSSRKFKTGNPFIHWMTSPSVN